MSAFWRLVRGALRYRGLIGIGLAAALLDAACAFSGFGALLVVINRFFQGAGPTLREQAAARLADPRVVHLLGDHTAWARWIPASAFGGFVFVLGVILALTIVGSVMRIIYQLCATTIGLRTIMRIRKAVFQRLIHAPVDPGPDADLADRLSRVVRDANQLAAGFNALMAKAVRDILVGTAMLLIALMINWVLTLIFLLGLPVIAVCIRKFGKKVRRASKYANRAYGGMLAALQESLQGIAVVKVHNAEGYERRRFNRINRHVYAQEFRARLARAMSSPIVELIGVVGVMIVSLVAAYMVYVRHTGPPQDVVYVLVALAAAGASYRPLANLTNDVQQAAAAADRLEEILHLPAEPAGLDQATPLARHHESVRFEDVGYRYPAAARFAVRHVSVAAPHGQTLAIVGHNGSGKSTLLNLLPRLTRPEEGRVLIDGQDIAKVTLRSLRRQMAMVTQQTVLFEGTIAENIAYGARHVSREDIVHAAQAAYAHGFIQELPEGYDAPLGEMGSGLSGGQKQRLCIARAILRDPAILILDEATSQIDADSEAKINAALARFKRGRTTFVIAHRLSTVVDADRIMVMREGRMADIGSHDQLLQRCEAYRLLTRTQLGAEESPPQRERSPTAP